MLFSFSSYVIPRITNDDMINDGFTQVYRYSNVDITGQKLSHYQI